jgi:hypothetical protein
MTDSKRTCVVCGSEAVPESELPGDANLCEKHRQCPECFGLLRVSLEDEVVGSFHCHCGIHAACHNYVSKVEDNAWRLPWVSGFLRGRWLLKQPKRPGAYFVRLHDHEVSLVQLLEDGGVRPPSMGFFIVAWWSEPLPNLPELT